MEQHEEASKSFGSYLRKVREGCRLSLDAVEEMSAGYVERVTKSHLSRIENGQAVPSFTRLYTLSRIYGVPVSSLAERFEVDLRRQQIPPETLGKPEEEALAEAKQLRMSGRYVEALAIYEALLDRGSGRIHGPTDSARILDLRLHRVNCLWHLGTYRLAKDECEQILSSPHLTAGRRLLALENFVMCCVNLNRFAVAMMALEQVEKDLGSPEAPARVGADLAAIRGFVHGITGSPAEAAVWYAKAISLYEEINDAFEACRCKVNLGQALLESGDRYGALVHLNAGLKIAEASGYDRHKALALGHLALLSLEEGNAAAAEGYALRSNAIARPREYVSLVFRNCYYLWKIARSRGDEAGVRANERTLRTYVTRVEEYVPEVAAFREHLAGERA